MFRVFISLAVIVGVVLCGYLIWDYTKKEPYEDLQAVSAIYKESRLKERHSDFQIASPDDVKFVDIGERFRVEYGKSNFYLFKETMYSEEVKDMLWILEIELKMDKERNLVVLYKGEEIPTYVDV